MPCVAYGFSCVANFRQESLIRLRRHLKIAIQRRQHDMARRYISRVLF